MIRYPKFSNSLLICPSVCSCTLSQTIIYPSLSTLTNKFFKKGGTYSKVDRIIHLIRRSEISEKRTWSVLDRSAWYRSSLECRVVTDGCDDIIDDEEFCILSCGFSQFGEDLGAVWVAPVVKDLFLLKKTRYMILGSWIE